jgi:hypothetical protein
MTVRRYQDGADTGEVHQQFYRRGGIRAASLALAGKPTAWGSVGAMVSLLHGRTITRYAVAPTGDRQFEFPQDSRSEVQGYRGALVELGALVQPAPTVSVGLKASLPYARRSSFVFSSQTSNRNRVNMPLSYALGVAMQVTPQTRAAVDVRHAPLTYATLNGQPGYYPHDLTSLHLGVEHRRMVGGVVQSFMAGAFTHPTMETDARGARIHGGGVSLGTSRPFGALELDFAATYVGLTPQYLVQESATYRMIVRERALTLNLGLRLRK